MECATSAENSPRNAAQKMMENGRSLRVNIINKQWNISNYFPQKIARIQYKNLFLF